MARLALHLFGTPRVALDGVPTPIQRRKALALLAYLAVTQQPHSRETLSTLFWPESDHTHARMSLRRHLSELNGALGMGRVVADRASVVFPHDSDAWVDVARFRELLAQCRSHGHPPKSACAGCLPLLEEAVALYDSDFLRGFTLADSPEFDEWQSYETEGLRSELASALERLGQAYAAEEQYSVAIAHVRRWLSMDPLHEPAHQLLAGLYVKSGQHAAARQQYGEYADLLEREFRVSISETFEEFCTPLHNELHALHTSAMRLTNDTHCADDRLAAATLPVFLRSNAEPSADTAGPFVGRDHRIAQLDAFLATALAGRGQTVVVSGEAGSGKTMLLQEFARRAQLDHADLIVAQGRCDLYAGVGDPYLPFRDILQLLCGDVEAQCLAGALTRDHARRLWGLMPETVDVLHEVGPDLAGVFLSPATAARVGANRMVSAHGTRLQDLLLTRSRVHGPDQSRLFEQFADVLRRLAARRPLLLVLDDLHWADVSSSSLLFHLSRRITDSRILIAGAYRPEEVAIGMDGRSHPLQQIVGELKRRAGEIEVNLDHDMTAEGRHFVDALLDVQPNRLDEAFRRALFGRSRGHALFTVELLRDLQESGGLVLDERGRWVQNPDFRWESVPARVGGVIEKRVGRLNGDLREILAVASVEGENFTAEIVARALGIDPKEVVRLLSAELEWRHRLVHAQGVQRIGNQRMSVYRFRHNLFRIYLLDSLDSVQRSYLHEQVGAAIERVYAEQAADAAPVAAQLAQHFDEAGQTEKAIDYCYQAGQQAIRLSANDEAIGYLARGLALLAAMPDSPENRQRGIQYQIALGVPLSARLGYASPETERTYDKALELCRGVEDTAQQFPALYGMWRYFLMRAKSQIAMELALRLMHLAQQVQDRSLTIEAERAIGISHFHLGELLDARVHLERGSDIYDFEADREHAFLYGHDPMVSFLGYLALTLWQLGYPDQALARVQELLGLAQDLSHPFSLAHALTVGALQTYQYRGEVQSTYDLAQEALKSASDLGFPLWVGRATFYSGWALATQGQPTAGIAQMREGVNTWRAAGTEACLPYFLTLLAEAYVGAGQAQTGLATLEEAFSAMQSNDEREREAELYRVRGLICAALGASDAEAESLYCQAVDIARQRQAKSLELRAATSLGHLWRRQGRRPEARKMLAEVYDWFREGHDTSDLKEAEALLGLLQVEGCP